MNSLGLYHSQQLIGPCTQQRLTWLLFFQCCLRAVLKPEITYLDHVHYHTVQKSTPLPRETLSGKVISQIPCVSQRYRHLRPQTTFASFPSKLAFFPPHRRRIRFHLDSLLTIPAQFAQNKCLHPIGIPSRPIHPLTANRRSPCPAVSLVRQLGPPVCRSRRLLCGQRDLFFPSPYPISPSL